MKAWGAALLKGPGENTDNYGKGDYINSTHMMLHCSILAYAYLLHPAQARLQSAGQETR